MNLSELVKKDLGHVLTQLASLGLEPTECQFSPEMFGNVVQFHGSFSGVEIIKDRGQYFIGGSRPKLEALGLWRALGSKQELMSCLRVYLAAAV